MASESSKVETDVRKFSLQCLADTILPYNMYWVEYFVNESGELFALGDFDNEGKISVRVHDKVKNEWTRVEQKGSELPLNGLGWDTCHGRYKENTLVFCKTGWNGSYHSIREIWFFDTEMLTFKKVQIKQTPQSCYSIDFLSCVVGLKLMLECLTNNSDGGNEHWSLDLEEAELYGKGYWKKMEFPNEKAWYFNSVMVNDQLLWCNWNSDSISKIDFKNKTTTDVKINLSESRIKNYFKCGVGKDLLAVGTDEDDQLQILSTDTSGHEGNTTLTLTPLVPGDRTTKLLLGQKFHRAEFVMERLPSRGDMLILVAETKGKKCVFGLKLLDPKCEYKGLANHMKKILSSGDFADMALIVGQNKTRIPLHKTIMVQSPWIERRLSCQTTATAGKISEIEFAECELEEVSLILDLLYTGTFQKPGPTDGNSWFKLWKASKKFEMDNLADECWKNIPEDLIKEVAKQFPSEASKKIKKCAVCFQELVEPFVCLIPCGHTDTCSDCTEKIRNQRDFQRCPICQSDIKNINNIYI